MILSNAPPLRNSQQSTAGPNQPSKPVPPAWKIGLPPDALDGLYSVPCAPPIPPRLRLWTWLCEKVPLLRRYRGRNEAAPMLLVPLERKAELLAMLCDEEVREAALAILGPGIDSIARRAGGGA